MNVPAIPKTLLPDTIKVRVPAESKYGGGYARAKTITNCRLDAKNAVMRGSSYVWVDGTTGLLFIDARNSEGAFEIPVGSLISVNGKPEVSAVQVDCYRPYDEVHHWEIQVK